jgi:hypothetical protein
VVAEYADAGRSSGLPAEAASLGTGKGHLVYLTCGDECQVVVFHTVGERKVTCPVHGGNWVVSARLVQKADFMIRQAPPDVR